MKFSDATWHAVVNFTKGGQEQVQGVVVHIMAGTLEGSQSWFNNPKAQASSHFGTGKDGELRQWVDTADRAWAQAAGNRTHLSVENEGQGGDSLTKAQITANAKVLAWAHTKYGVPLRLATAADKHGLAYHSLGGSAWGSHPSCPGTKIIAQLPEILTEAKKILEIKDTPAKPIPKPAPVYAPFPGASFFRIGRTSKVITAMGKALVKAGYKGYKVGPGPVFTSGDKKAVAWFQRQHAELAGNADGIPGPKTWKLLKVPKV
jgi:hypothetical protein